jgi:hypothetical protein
MTMLRSMIRLAALGAAAPATDQLTATVTSSGTTYTLTLADTSQGWSKTATKTLAATNASVEVIMESPVALDASNAAGFEDHTSALSGGTNFSISYLRE